VVCRLALTDQDRQARDLVTRWFHEAGLSVRVDEVGNVFGRRAGTDPQAAAVATGSHIDTQPSGGKFDGNYGVMAGLEVVRTLNDRASAPAHRSRWRSGPTRKARASRR
jgi:N-carbamoyl-L-amino-acid hydrolase